MAHKHLSPRVTNDEEGPDKYTVLFAAIAIALEASALLITFDPPA